MTDHMGHGCLSRVRPTVRRESAGGSGFPVRALAALGVVILASVTHVIGGVASQTDWSGGNVETGAVSDWDRTFAAAEAISWLAVPGQITLSGVVLETAAKHVISGDFLRPSSLDAADIDGDGDSDLVGAAFGGHQIRWWRNEGGSPPTWTPLIIETGFAAASSVRAADVDGDGMVDIAGCAWTDGELVVWYNNGQGVSWTRQSVATGLSECHWVDVADLNGDGTADLMGAAADPGLVAVWLSDGGTPIAWTQQIIDGAYGGARSLVPADLDADGDVDLLGTALVDDDISWWRNDGGDPLAWTQEILSDSFGGAHHADAWDMDLDGDLDIVAAGFGHPWLKLWRHDGGDPIGWSEEQIDGVILTPLVVDAGDLDGDGDMDVVATSNNWNRVMWWQNNGGPVETWSVTDLARDFPNAWPLATADLDGNGALDVISGASGGTEVAWWRPTDFVESGVLESRVMSIPDHVVTLKCSLEADEPSGTDVTVDIRIGAALNDLGDWIPIEPGHPWPVQVRGPAYLQYRVSLTTLDPSAAPVVREIALEWTSELESRQSSTRRLRP